MPARRVRATVLTLLVGTALPGCGSFGGPAVPADAERINIVNSTTAPIEVRVNGTWIGTYPAWSQQLELPIHGNGGPPWDIEFLGPGGLRFGVLHVTADSGNPVSSVAYASPCGEFVAWWGAAPGDVPVIEGMTPPPAKAGCGGAARR